MAKTPSLLVRAVLVAVVGSLGACASMGEIHTVQDPFLGPQTGFVIYLDLGGYTAVGVSEAQGKFTLEVLVVQRGVSDLLGHPGDKGQFIVGGKLLTFDNAIEVKPVSNATRYEAFTQWKPVFNLTREEAAQFAAGPLTAVKVWVGDQWFQLELGKLESEKFQSNLAIMTGQAPRG
jgi:hypothetical protein